MAKAFSKRSQVAMESLMVYGIAILIVMLAVGALIYFGVLDLGAYLPDRAEIKGGDFTIKEIAVHHGGDVELVITNNVGKNIESLIVEIQDEGDSSWGCSTPTLMRTDTGDISGTNPLANGDDAELTGSYALSCDVIDKVGKKISGIINLRYNVMGSSIDRSAHGTIRVTVIE